MNKLDLQYHLAVQSDTARKTIYDQQLLQVGQLQVSQELKDAVISYALRVQKSLVLLTQQDFIEINNYLKNIFIEKQLTYLIPFDLIDLYQEVIKIVITELEQKLKQSSENISNKKILHTAPHHDDIILGYYPFMMKLLKENKNHILYITDGSNGVADEYIIHLLADCLSIEKIILQQMVFENFYQQLLELFAEGFHQDNHEKIMQARKFIFLKIIVEIFGSTSVDQLREQIMHLHESLLESPYLEILKGRLRQSESDSKWMILQGHIDNVTHFGAAFYHDDSYQAINRDIDLFVKYLEQIQPDMITIALDPCGVGPTTHFMSLQVIAKALQKYGNKNIEIIAYRNVWSAFTIAQSSVMIRVTPQEIDLMTSIFLTCFATQKKPIFPSPLDDGPFSKIVTQFMEQQGQDLAILLGKQEVSDSYLFLQKLTIDELLQFARL